MSRIDLSAATVSVNDLGVDPALQVKIAPILSGIRDKCLRMGAHGFDLLRRKLNTRDNRVASRMDPDKFRMALAELGIVVTGQELKYLTLAFKEDTGYLRMNMLCDHICGFLSEERARIVDHIFDLLDVDGSGELNVEDLKGVADFRNHPDVLSNKLTAEQAMRRYLDVFDGQTPDGCVTRDEFRAYYAGVSENCPTLEYFEEVARAAWKFLDLSKLSAIKSARATPADAAGSVGGTMGSQGTGTFVPPRAGASTFKRSGSPERGVQPSKRVVGYTGHVPMARERFGETFHRVDAATPNLQREPNLHYGPKYVDEKNAFVKSGNKSNAHSFKMA